MPRPRPLPCADPAALCRSRLAGECVLTFNIEAGWSDAFAGKPGSYRGATLYEDIEFTNDQLWERDRLAGECVLTFNIEAVWSGAFAGKPGSYRGATSYEDIEFTHDNCGSGLARDEATPVDINVA